MTTPSSHFQNPPLNTSLACAGPGLGGVRFDLLPQRTRRAVNETRVVTESPEHLAHYQALFREVNNCIRDVADLDVGIFMCECGHPDCLSTVDLSPPQYDRIRSNPNWFLLTPGHMIPEIARVVSEDDGFVVVETLTVFDDAVA